MSAKEWLRLHTRSQRVNAMILASRLSNGGFNLDYNHPLWNQVTIREHVRADRVK